MYVKHRYNRAGRVYAQGVSFKKSIRGVWNGAFVISPFPSSSVILIYTFNF